MNLQEMKAKATDMNMEIMDLQADMKEKSAAYVALLNEIRQTPAEIKLED